MNKPRSFLRTVGSISSATLLSRILGLVRDQVQSYYFGAGQVTDAFIAAFRIPNMLRDLFAEGALSSAFVPTFTAEKEKRGAAAAWSLANRVGVALALILGSVALLTALGAPWILDVLAGGFSDEKHALATTMTRILAPFLLFVALAAVAMGALNTFGRFFLPALAPASFNVAAILGVILLVPVLPRLGWDPSLALAIGALVGGALQFLVQLPELYRHGFRFRPQIRFRDPGVRRIGRLMLPATIGLAATQVNILVDTYLASRFDDGPITWLMLGFRLMQLPLGLFGVAIATANLARVSQDAARGDLQGMQANLGSAFRAAAILALPSTAGLIALRVPIIQLLLEHGEFSHQDTLNTAAAVLCYSVGLFAYSVTKIQVPTFYALDQTRTPVIASVTAVSFKIATNFVLIAWFTRAGIPPFLGLALSTSLAAWINFTILALALRVRIGALVGQQVVTTCLKLLVISAAMGFACHWSHAALESLWGGEGLLLRAVRLGLVLLLAVTIWAGGVLLAGIPEGRKLAGYLKGLLRPKG